MVLAVFVDLIKRETRSKFVVFHISCKLRKVRLPMMYNYIKLADDKQIAHSNILDDRTV